MKNESKLFLFLIAMSPAMALCCPVGSVAVRGNGWEGCVPGQSEQKEASGPRWRARWGAIATDTPKGILGAVNGLSNKRSAEKAALTKCYNDGGQKCVIQITYTNHCVAMATGGSSYGMISAATLEQAIELTMKKCNANDKNCSIYYTGCSLPELVEASN